MRTINSDLQAKLAAGEAVEPVVIAVLSGISLDQGWSDKAIVNDSIVRPARIVDLSDIDESKRSDSSGLSGSVTIKLDDRDGSMKAWFDTTDIHKLKVDLHQTFDGVNGSFPIFSGQISTPIIWDEGSRTLQFDVVTKLEDQEIGWSIEMGNYPYIPPDLVGVGWPMVFGTVLHSPCLQLETIPTGFTTASFGLPDTTIAGQIVQLENLLQEAIWATLGASADAANANPSDPLDFENRVQNDATVQNFVQMQYDIQIEIQRLQMAQESQIPAGVSFGPVPIVTTSFVSRPFSGRVKCGNNIFTATMSQYGGMLNCVPVPLPGSPANTNVREGFEFYPAGSSVIVADNYTIDYVASITPGTVHDVWAMRSFKGVKQMAKVPTSYYATRIDGNATIISLLMPLTVHELINSMNIQTWENTFGKHLPPHIVNTIDWEDQLFVTFESSIGPNPVDILIWFIETYTTNGYDSTSFEAARTGCSVTPMNFTITERKNVLDILTEIAYQARCMIYLRNDTFYLTYLPALPTIVDSISEDDVVVGSLQVTCTPTEDLITKYVATFRPDYSPFFTTPATAIFRYNINKYGVHEETHDFFCYNNFLHVEKAATFWMIRKSQTWKILKAKLLLTKINLEAFDAVTLDFAHPYLANESVTGFITSAKYNSAEGVIDVEIWTPVLLGTMEANKFFWPAGLSEQDIWPQYHDIGSGGGQSLSNYSNQLGGTMRLPVGVIDGFSFLKQGYDDFRDKRPTWTSGDPYPGDDTPYWNMVTQNMPTINADLVKPYVPVPGAFSPQDYTYKPLPSVDLYQNKVYAGCVQEKVDYDQGSQYNQTSYSQGPKGVNKYNVLVYTKGLAAKPETMVAIQLQEDKDDTIPPNTWVLCNLNICKDENGKFVRELVMQVPVWLR